MPSDDRSAKVVALDFQCSAPESLKSPELTLPQLEAAQYIADMVLQLRNLARSVHIDRGLPELEAAYYAFFALANSQRPRPEEAEYVRSLKTPSTDDTAPIVVPDAFKDSD